MSSSVECDVLVIGAGVIGLACATRAAERGRQTILIEANAHFGEETSSRNSEVIHSGIYYGTNTNKTRWCVEGRSLLYAYCEKKGISHSRLGKMVVSVNEQETAYLQTLADHCRSLAVPHVFLSKTEAEKREPLLAVREALFFPETGIVDSHQLMAALERDFLSANGMVAYQHRLLNTERRGDTWEVSVQSPAGMLVIRTPRLINAAGLYAARLANQILDTHRFEHRYCRGRYFTLGASYRRKFQHLVYPVPQEHGLGVHVTLDTDGMVRLGPDVDWIEKLDQSTYTCDWNALSPHFARAAQSYFPSLQESALSPGQIGVRPKLYVDGDAHKDFWLETASGSTHCLGIESPGLTAALAIAQHIDL